MVYEELRKDYTKQNELHEEMLANKQALLEQTIEERPRTENQILGDMEQDKWIVKREIEMLDIEKRTFREKRKELQEKVTAAKKGPNAKKAPIASPRKNTS